MPMKKLLQHCHALCAEEYEAEVPYTQRHDEVGILANSLEVLRQKAGEAFRLRQVLDDLPISVMTADMRDEFRINYANKQSQHLLRGIQKHLPVSVDKLIGTSIDVFHKDPMRIRHLLQTPEHLPHRAKVQIGDEVMQLQASAIYDKKGNYLSPVLAWDMITGKEKLSDNFESSVGSVVNTLVGAAGDLEERAVTLQGAIEELSITAADISSRASDSLKIVRDSNEKGEEARNCMLQLAEAAEQITSVVTLISSIADKTNLLALNATIESARAGEAGRGFAVVASEVKTLANQTSDAITGIAARITEIQQVSQRARSAVQEICEGVSSIEEVATGIAGTIEQQRASTSEIARHISGGVVNHLGTDYGSVLTYAMQLKEVSQTLKVECGAFLESVRKM
jgi:methyl-accepting chemotaxis protein